MNALNSRERPKIDRRLFRILSLPSLLLFIKRHVSAATYRSIVYLADE